MLKKKKNLKRINNTKKKIEKKIPIEEYIKFSEIMKRVEPFINPSLQPDFSSTEVWNIQDRNVLNYSI